MIPANSIPIFFHLIFYNLCLGENKLSIISPSDLKIFRQAGLERHNMYREWHGVPKMTLDDRLNKQAMEYAENLMKTETFAHSDHKERPEDGENLHSKSKTGGGGINVTNEAVVAVDAWYYELCDKTGAMGKKEFNHFTQAIWKDSTKLGMGIGLTKDKDTEKCRVVGRYNPFGNVEGQKKEKVPTAVCPTEKEFCEADKQGKDHRLVGVCDKDKKIHAVVG